MYVCKNCSHTQETNSVDCNHCKISGMLIKDNRIELKDTSRHLDKSYVCRNCGSIHQENIDKCSHCKFPMSSVNPLNIRRSKIV